MIVPARASSSARHHLALPLHQLSPRWTVSDRTNFHPSSLDGRAARLYRASESFLLVSRQRIVLKENGRWT